MNLSDILNHGPAGEHQQPRPVLSDERSSNPTYPPVLQQNYHPQQHHEPRYHESFIPRTQTIPIHTHPSGRPTTGSHSSVPSSASSSSSPSPSASSNMSLTPTSTPIEDIQGPPRCSYCDDCTTRSPLRKVVSHVFGRNKAETRAIPQNVWVYYCRKHYQRSRYRNPNGFAVLQCELVRRQIDRLITWGGVENWSVKVRKGGKDNSQNGRNPAAGLGYPGGDMDMEDDMADLDDMAPGMNMSMNSSNNTSSSSSPQPPNLAQGPNDPNSTTWLAKFEGHGKTMKEIKHLVDEIEKSLEILGGTFPDVELLPHCYTTPSHEDEENGWMKESHRRKSGPRGGSGRKVRNKGGALSAIQTARGPVGASGSMGPGPGPVRRRMTTGDVPLHSPSILLDSPHHPHPHQQYHHHSQHHHHHHGAETISASTSPEATEFDEAIFSDQSSTPSASRSNSYYTHTQHQQRPSFRGGFHSYSHYRDEEDTRTPTPSTLYHQPPHLPHHHQQVAPLHHHQQLHSYQDVGRPDIGRRDEVVITPPGSVPASSRRTSMESKMLQGQPPYHASYGSGGPGLPPSPKSLRRYDENGRWVE
ncbi:hypothetical protein BJ508DRAFT_116372 [Ascobolus immersus RN42]|uniref:Uncharacterized protein n=1 Tax=Ascobolus immersus RN42 TaxID=1160509 RepID=A0A3N4IA56_ASCIM|nr:hypothetical protein BJ508DRAFT_116372 [Ascobolus immersus RN42]